MNNKIFGIFTGIYTTVLMLFFIGFISGMFNIATFNIFTVSFLLYILLGFILLLKSKPDKVFKNKLVYVIVLFVIGIITVLYFLI